MADQTNEETKLFYEGIKLFNDGEWFTAHEVWEDVWHMATGEKKLFYQGLIQVAVTLEHARRGNPRGVRAVWTTCVPKFDGLGEVYMGINIRHILDGVGRVVRPILDLPGSYYDPSRGRGQDLPVQWRQVPKIELEYDPFAQ